MCAKKAIERSALGFVLVVKRYYVRYGFKPHLEDSLINASLWGSREGAEKSLAELGDTLGPVHIRAVQLTLKE